MAKGLKLNNEKSTVIPPVKAMASEAFNKAADEAAERLTGYKQRSWDTGVKFKSIMESSVLPENKSILIKEMEAETLQQLSQLALDINADDINPDGMGGVALCQLIMKMMITQKDQISVLRYRVEELEKKLKTD